ncbi:MAG: 8-oxo-dGTP diphosphatase [Candidatus Gracilibacteria bacterium]|nr:8-oxo-dGTP diphosphatase [Candidatus Gracilibacteria bacterium]
MKLATLCYLKKDSKTLMLHRVKKENDTHEGKWNGVGGKFELGETPEECAIREIKEETGLIAKNPILKGILTFPNFAAGEDWYVFVYEFYEFSGEIIESNEGNLEWVNDENILSLNLWEGDKHFLKWIQEGRFFSGKFIYENKKLVSHEVTFH